MLDIVFQDVGNIGTGLAKQVYNTVTGFAAASLSTTDMGHGPDAARILTAKPTNAEQEIAMDETAVAIDVLTISVGDAVENPATEQNGTIVPYNRELHYGRTPTSADRAAIGGESVDHDPPLVQRYYEGDPAKGEKPGMHQTQAQREASASDRARMKRSTKKAQRKQGGRMAHYSRKKKKELGLSDNKPS